MVLKRFFTGLRGTAARPHKRRAIRVYSTRRFQEILNRERARAERNGHIFSLVAFKLNESLPIDKQVHTVLELVELHLKCFDQCGWLPDNRLAIVLPYSSAKEANELADHVVGGWPSSVPSPQTEIFSYPSQWSRGDLLTPITPVEADADADFDRKTQGMETLFVKHTPTLKRAIDMLGAGIGLVVASPVLLTAAAAIKITAPGPIFFKQWRTGAGGRPFLMYKLRSMHIDAEARQAALRAKSEQDGPAFKIKNDPRITPIGAFLRKSSIDELPQLWNVLIGDMSLVGPRPLPCDEANACLNWQRRRLDVTPGLTCIWQVRGRSRVSFNEWMLMDLEYVAQRSLWQDIKILVATVPAVLLRRGAA